MPVTVPDDSGNEQSGLDLYFIDREGGNFKVKVFHRPYFLVDVRPVERLMEVASHLQRRIEGCIVETIDKEDLDMPNHLSGKKHRFLKLNFSSVSALMDAKTMLRPIVQVPWRR
jgi:DNA polymerase epsilon subunit 1